jgi:hypothetical protein
VSCKTLIARVIDRVDQLPHHGAWIGADGAHDIDELDDAEPTLAALVLGDVRLRLVQALGHLCLCEKLALAEFPQRSTQLFLARRAQSVPHRLRPGAKTAASPHNPSSGLSHFGILISVPADALIQAVKIDRGEGAR